VVLALGVVGVAGGLAFWGRSAFFSKATANPADNVPQTAEQPPSAPPLAPELPSDYLRRVAAYIYGSEAITYEDLARYLIERCADRLDNLINARIIEHVCRDRGITVTE